MRIYGRFACEETPDGVVFRVRDQWPYATLSFAFVCVSYVALAWIASFDVLSTAAMTKESGAIVETGLILALGWCLLRALVFAARRGGTISSYSRVTRAVEVHRRHSDGSAENPFRVAADPLAVVIDGRAVSGRDEPGVFVAVSDEVKSRGKYHKTMVRRFRPTILAGDMLYELDIVEGNDASDAQVLAEEIARAMGRRGPVARVHWDADLSNALDDDLVLTLLAVADILLLIVAWLGAIMFSLLRPADPTLRAVPALLFGAVAALSLVVMRGAMRVTARRRAYAVKELLDNARRALALVEEPAEKPEASMPPSRVGGLPTT